MKKRSLSRMLQIIASILTLLYVISVANHLGLFRTKRSTAELILNESDSEVEVEVELEGRDLGEVPDLVMDSDNGDGEQPRLQNLVETIYNLESNRSILDQLLGELPIINHNLMAVTPLDPANFEEFPARTRQIMEAERSSRQAGELVELLGLRSLDMGNEDMQEDADNNFCQRIRDVQVYRFKGFQQHGVLWVEKMLYRLIQRYCKEFGECEASEYTHEEGVAVDFPLCGRQWRFLAKAKHTNHAGGVKAKHFGIVNLLIVRDPRDALISYFEFKFPPNERDRTKTNDELFGAFFEEFFPRMITYMKENSRRSIEADGIVLRYEELHSNPVNELKAMSAVFGFKPTDEFLAKVIKENSFLISNAGNKLKVVASVEKKGVLKSEDNYSMVGEHLQYPLFKKYEERAKVLMEEGLPPELTRYWLGPN